MHRSGVRCYETISNGLVTLATMNVFIDVDLVASHTQGVLLTKYIFSYFEQ